MIDESTLAAPQDPPSQGIVLSGRGLTKRYRGRTLALDNVSVVLRHGEILSLVGPSGCGKSTLLLTLAGLLSLDAGEVEYLSKPLSIMADRDLATLRRDEFGFVFQFGHLVRELTALENVALPLRLRGEPRQKANEVAAEQLERVGVDHLASLRPGEMSGGEAQRVAVARALVAGPRVVFADEPTGSLDSVNGAIVMDLLVRCVKEQGSSLLLVTHDMQVASVGDRKLSMLDGRIISQEGA